MERLAADLTSRFGRGYSIQNLYLMRQFRLAWPPDRILQSSVGESAPIQILESAIGESAALPVPGFASPPTLDSPVWAKLFPLPWTAYVRLMAVKNDFARRFYETEALRNGWTIALGFWGIGGFQGGGLMACLWAGRASSLGLGRRLGRGRAASRPGRSGAGRWRSIRCSRRPGRGVVVW
ncbi:MAG: DUF1016 N-terminal domain-containing protein [Bifidobacteriaceae bacterium]|nr:DUF1016 N-terminal domain-containing protein [Bifidobacteriaceae bacterium]